MKREVATQRLEELSFVEWDVVAELAEDSWGEPLSEVERDRAVGVLPEEEDGCIGSDY